MKKFIRVVGIIACLSGVVSASDFDLGISGSNKGIDGFSLSVGNYYGAPQQEVVEIERSLSHDDMSVVYFLARKSHNGVHFITDLRRGGMSWWNISYRLGLDPQTLYVVESRRHSGPPYGKAYGHQKMNKRHLRDSEIAELVNVRFLSDYHHVSADDVIDHRRRGENYNRINEHYSGKQSENRRNERSSKGGKENRGNSKQERGNRHHER